MSTEAARHSDRAVVAKNRPAERVATLFIGGQTFGVSLLEIRDILTLEHIFSIPLAPPTILGSINLRGRIVTVINLRECLGLKSTPIGDGALRYCMTVEFRGCLYGLLVDRIGDIVQVSEELRKPVPSTLSSNWRSICSGIYLVENALLLQLNTASLLDQLLMSPDPQ